MSKISVQHFFKFQREILFDAFTAKDSVQEFLFRTENGKLIEASMDAEVGGSFFISEDRGGKTYPHFGTFVELDRPEKISFVFSTENESGDSSFVEIFFESVTGGAQLTLTQEISEQWESFETKIKSSWTFMLENLDLHLQKQALNEQPTKDSQGHILSEGDSVKVIKDLNVKGSSMVVKRGTIVKKIHLLAGNETEIDCKVDGVALALETRWLVKV